MCVCVSILVCGAFRALSDVMCVHLYRAVVRSGLVGSGVVAGSPSGRSDRKQKAAEWLQPGNKTPSTSHQRTGYDLLREEHHTYTKTQK